MSFSVTLQMMGPVVPVLQQVWNVISQREATSVEEQALLGIFSFVVLVDYVMIDVWSI